MSDLKTMKDKITENTTDRGGRQQLLTADTTIIGGNINNQLYTL